MRTQLLSIRSTYKHHGPVPEAYGGLSACSQVSWSVKCEVPIPLLGSAMCTHLSLRDTLVIISRVLGVAAGSLLEQL